jgi:uncharacterized protein
VSFTDFKNQIEKQIKRLSCIERLRFALNICSRLLPDYKAFHEKYGWGNPTNLEQGFKYCEQVLNGDSANNIQIEEIKKSIIEVTPDTEDFSDYDGSYALNACSAVIECLEFVSDKDIEHITNISSYMTDSIDFKISEKFGRLSDDAIDAHPWMINEINIQIALTKQY